MCSVPWDHIQVDCCYIVLLKHWIYPVTLSKYLISNSFVFTVRFAQYRAPQLTLKPLFFEVPLQEPDPLFLGRHWLIREMEESLGSASPGVLITGSPGTGKSALILQLVDYSCFGRRRDPKYQQGKCLLYIASSQASHFILLMIKLITLSMQD